MSKERIDVYDLEGRWMYLQEREECYKDIYEEYRKDGKVTKQVRIVKGFLLSPAGNCYVQLRSKQKQENGGLLDKTIGGHVLFGNLPSSAHDDVTFILECQQELGIPMMVVSDDMFSRIHTTIDLSVIGIAKKLGIVNAFQSKRCLPGGEIMVLPQIVTFYLGYYNGPFQFKDGEASGILSYSKEDLFLEILNSPTFFTNDLKEMISVYGDEIKSIL